MVCNLKRARQFLARWDQHAVVQRRAYSRRRRESFKDSEDSDVIGYFLGNYLSSLKLAKYLRVRWWA